MSSNWQNHDKTSYHNYSPNSTDISMGMLASLIWPSLNLNASFSTNASMSGLLSQIGMKVVFDRDILSGINLYESIVFPLSVTKPLEKTMTGIYGSKSSVDTIDLTFNITANIADDFRSFSYKSPDKSAFGAAATSALSTAFIIFQNVVNAGMKLGLNLNNLSSDNSSYVESEYNEGCPAFWLGILGLTFGLFNITCFYKGLKLRQIKMDRGNR